MDAHSHQKSPLQPLEIASPDQPIPPTQPAALFSDTSNFQRDGLAVNRAQPRNPHEISEDDNQEMAYVGSHTQSWTWSSPRALQEDLYSVAKVSVERHFRGYDRDLLEALKGLDKWCEHATNLKMVAIKLEQRRIMEKELYQRLRSENQIHKAFGGRKLSIGMGAVLCHHTLWCADYKTDWRRLAPWPSIAEQKWEGEDRARTKVGRYFPLPREPSNGSVPWNYLPMITSSPFDQIWKIPSELDILYPMSQINAEVQHDQHALLNQDILDAMELGPNDVWAKDDLSLDQLISL
ncbi:hypothetical protein B0J12DRAFT_695621 [Macrophomina phaseolina]|uniref:Uncharacterized protein n=1 Tax=Macrophomina phaseolina TaxID=35725 RepID=A0ABQ8GRL8_9PEZI|nr:hypothetical protein B0J12DRAFT_695621 [Macrophomina phaseolina]